MLQCPYQEGFPSGETEGNPKGFSSLLGYKMIKEKEKNYAINIRIFWNINLYVL